MMCTCTKYSLTFTIYCGRSGNISDHPDSRKCKLPGQATASASRSVATFAKTLTEDDNPSHGSMFTYYFIKQDLSLRPHNRPL